MRITGRCEDGAVAVTIDGNALDWKGSLEVRHHSPSGPNWGNEGQGAAQLALAILIAVTGDEYTATQYYQQFKSAVLAPIHDDDWHMEGDDVAEWVRKVAQGEPHVVPVEVEPAA